MNNSTPSEKEVRLQLMKSNDLSQHIEFDSTGVICAEKIFENPKEKIVTLLYSVKRDDDEGWEAVKAIIEHEEKKENAVYIPREFNAIADEVFMLNTTRYAINNSSKVAIVYANSTGIRLGYGMAIAKVKPTMIIHPEVGLETQLLDWDRPQDCRSKRMDNLSIFPEDWKGYEKGLTDIRAFTPAKISLDYVKENDLGDDCTPKLTDVSAVVCGMLLATNKPFILTNYDEVKAAAKKEGKHRGISSAMARLHEWYNKE